MQAHPRLGILQSLVVGAPAESAFARIFQFGMRHGMRAYTFGSAWWTGDCGPFWGHNAVVRIAPFRDHCDLPILPGKPPLGGHVLSHDQVEATLMRRAGYEVRVLPEEGGSWEDNPPTLFDFSARDLRWCQGNMQYWRLLGPPGLLLMSRFQLAWAILMFVGVPAMTLMIALVPLKILDGEDLSTFPVGLAIGLYLTFLGMYLSPKLAGLADILLAKGGVARYGGLGRFLASAAIEIVFSFLLGAVTTFRITLFMIGLAVRTLGDLERAGARRAWRFMVRRRARPVAGIAVRRPRLRRLGGALAGDARLEPAADLRLSRRDPLCGLDGVGRRGGAPRAPRAVRHPGGARAAGRNPRPAGSERGARSRHGRGDPALARDLLSRSRPRPRHGRALCAASSKPATSPSTSAPMSATASPPSAASAPVSSRSSRSPGRRGRSG